VVRLGYVGEADDGRQRGVAPPALGARALLSGVRAFHGARARDVARQGLARPARLPLQGDTLHVVGVVPIGQAGQLPPPHRLEHQGQVEPGLWGGFATHLFANGSTILYPIPEDVTPIRAALFNVLGAGVKWGVDVAGTTLGSTVVVLGCGQRGLAGALSALEAGASFVAVTGLSQDDYKLQLARELGIHMAVDVDTQDVKDAILSVKKLAANAKTARKPYPSMPNSNPILS